MRKGYVKREPLDLVEPLELKRRLPGPVPERNPHKDVAKAIVAAASPTG